MWNANGFIVRIKQDLEIEGVPAERDGLRSAETQPRDDLQGTMEVGSKNGEGLVLIQLQEVGYREVNELVTEGCEVIREASEFDDPIGSCQFQLGIFHS